MRTRAMRMPPSAMAYPSVMSMMTTNESGRRMLLRRVDKLILDRSDRICCLRQIIMHRK
jgi:hypothetical protein